VPPGESRGTEEPAARVPGGSPPTAPITTAHPGRRTRNVNTTAATVAATAISANTHVELSLKENAAPGLYASCSPSRSPIGGMRSRSVRVATAEAFAP